MSVDFIPTADPLLRDARLDHAAAWPVLGIRTRIETNSRWVLGVAEESFGDWARAPAGHDEGVRVRVVVHEGREGVRGRAPVRHLAPDAARLVVQSPGSVGVADPERGESVAYVTTALAADREHFRVAMLEALTYALLAHRDRHPLHAAAVARGDRAVLLAGPSGAGKSTLAHAAHADGLDVLGEDHVWVQLDPTVGVWGAARRVRLLTGAGGTDKHEVEIRAPGRRADRATVCLLARGARGARASLARLAPEAVAESLGARVDPGFDRFPGRHAAVARALAAGGGWRLTLSDDPRDALPLLRQVLRDPGNEDRVTGSG